jgi:nicotinamide riboside kinase
VTKLVITGGPSAGKTTIAQAIQNDFQKEIQVVPEAASMLFQGGFPRGFDSESIKAAQLAIYHTQKQLEAIMTFRNPKKLILCDRGALDGAAYWPGSSRSFFQAVRSNRDRELKRYDWVLHLDTAIPSHYDTTNPVRLENPFEAKRINERIKKAWSTHPRVLVVPNQELFIKKIENVLLLLREIIKGSSTKSVKAVHTDFLRSIK